MTIFYRILKIFKSLEKSVGMEEGIRMKPF
jgi:hypothetical protein